MVVGIIYRYISPSGKSYIGQTTNENIRREHWNTLGPYAGRWILFGNIKIINYDVETNYIYVP